MSSFVFFDPAPSRRALVLLAAMTAPGFLAAQTWNAAGNGTWSTAGNWNPASVPTTGNTATLGTTSANRTVTYDGAASGALGTLAISQSSSSVNALDVQRNLSLANALVLGATGGGTARVIVGGNGTNAFTLTSANGITLNSGGGLVLASATNSANTGVNLGALSSGTPVAVSGGTLAIQATSGGNTGTAVSSIGGNFTMSSGVIALDNSVGGTDRRLALNGSSINITGGTVSPASRAGAQLQFNNTTAPANITFNPTSFGGNITFNLQSDFAQNFSTSQNVTVRIDMRGLGVKTLTSTAPNNGVGQIFLWDTNSGTPGSAATLRLGSNLTLNSGLGQPAVNGAGHTLESGRIDAAIDTNGFIFDLSSGSANGVWTPNAATQASATNTVWTLSGSGSFRANAFNLAAGNVTTNLGSGLVLNAVGGNATASDLGNNGTINSGSIFRYSGPAVSANASTLTFARNVGQVEVAGGGVLRILSVSNGTISGLSVSNGTLDLGGASRAVGSLTLTGGTLANGTYSLSSGNFTGLQTGTVSGVLSGGSGLVKNAGANLTLSGVNNFTGKVEVNAGTLSVGADNNLGAVPGSVVADQITLNGGTLSLTSGLTISANRGITLGASGGTIDVGGSLLPTLSIITGSGALTKTGTGFIRSGNNTFSGGFNLNQGWVRPTAFTTVSNSTVLGGPLGTGNLTVNGGGLSGASGFAPSYFVTQTFVNADFGVNTGAFGTGQTNRVDFAGPIDLRGAQRTVSLGRYTTAANSIGFGNSSLNFTSGGNLTTSIGNGTIRFVRESLGGASDYSSVNFDAATFTPGTGLTIGTNVITTMSQANPFGAVDGNQPAVTVESGGYFNMSDAGGARSPQIRSLAGEGVVTGLAASGTSILTVNPQVGDTAAFSGQIVDGSALNGTLGTSSAAVVRLAKTGAGTQILSGNNTYSGGTTVSAGTLQLSGGSLGSGAVSVAGGTLDLGGATITNTLGALTGGMIGNGTISNNGGDFDVQGGALGVILAGTNGLVKSGNGTVTLNAANTYSGDTTISSGTLSLGASGSIANSAVIINNGVLDVGAVSAFTLGASQTLTGSGSVTGNLAVSGALVPGNSPGILSVSGDLTLNNGAVTTMEIGGVDQGATFDHINVSGNIAWGGALNITNFGLYDIAAQSATYDLFGFAGALGGNFSGVSVASTSLAYDSVLGAWSGASGQASFSFTLADGVLVVSAIPEPGTFGMFAGLVAAGFFTVRRRRA